MIFVIIFQRPTDKGSADDVVDQKLCCTAASVSIISINWAIMPKWFRLTDSWNALLWY
jgi:hypothetical protein